MGWWRVIRKAWGTMAREVIARKADGSSPKSSNIASRASLRADLAYQYDGRLPRNVPGPFYTLGCRGPEGEWSGNCLACEAPEEEAPDLLAPLTEDNIDTYFMKQPRTPDEIERACSAISVCCVAALRYGGTDPVIIRRLGNDPMHSDYLLDHSGRVYAAPGGLAARLHHPPDDQTPCP